MVDVRSLAPDIEVEMRYAGANNFTGKPVPGYEADRCYLLEPVAQALARVQASLRAEGWVCASTTATGPPIRSPASCAGSANRTIRR